MSIHNQRERRLLTDLTEKNQLAGEFRRLSMHMQRWQQRMRKRHSKRWQAQYGGSIRRGEERLVELRAKLLTRAEDLSARIQEEQKISETEVRQFAEQYKKEVEELKGAQKVLAEAREALAEAASEAADTEEAAAVMAKLRRKQQKAARDVRRETKEVKTAKQEISSEEQDKVILTYEFRRILAEIESLRD